VRFQSMMTGLVLLAASCVPVWATDNIDMLRTALGHIPESTLATTDPMPIIYLDVQALLRAEDGALSEAGMRRLGLARMIRPLQSLKPGMSMAWTKKSGVAFEDIAYFAGFGQPPGNVSYWGFADASAANALFDALPALAFREVAKAPRILANGEPRMINFGIGDPQNPWLGQTGWSSFVFAADDALVQASAPDDLKPIIAMKRSAADNPAIKTALQGLSDASITKDTSIVQALVITPLFGLSAVDTSDQLPTDPQDLEAPKTKTETTLAGSINGIPAYLGGIMADVQRKEGPAPLVSLAYANCPTADIAVVALQARWKKAGDLSKLIDMTSQAVPAQNGSCAVVISFAAKPGVSQQQFEAYGNYLNRGFNLLQIGTAD